MMSSVFGRAISMIGVVYLLGFRDFIYPAALREEMEFYCNISFSFA